LDQSPEGKGSKIAPEEREEIGKREGDSGPRSENGRKMGQLGFGTARLEPKRESKKREDGGREGGKSREKGK